VLFAGVAGGATTGWAWSAAAAANAIPNDRTRIGAQVLDMEMDKVIFVQG
jgi:hypothetical protein